MNKMNHPVTWNKQEVNINQVISDSHNLKQMDTEFSEPAWKKGSMYSFFCKLLLKADNPFNYEYGQNRCNEEHVL